MEICFWRFHESGKSIHSWVYFQVIFAQCISVFIRKMKSDTTGGMLVMIVFRINKIDKGINYV